MSETFKYEGFISYAHADEVIAARLHKALETFKIPRDLIGVSTNRLSPIFRDATELSAHHSLSEKINEAVGGSRVLIVLCSPAAKASHWVNEEIRLFRRRRGEGSILCVLAKGTPETAFPPALLEGGREPLAANLGQSRDSFRLGITQLAASMLGVGLDSLIQRDARRRRRRMQGVTAAAVIFSSFMATTTFSAVKARKAAETNRMQAEGLVEFMISDLKDELQPVGRLDVLDSVGERAVEYYDSQNIQDLPDDSLARQARARHILGEVALDSGNYEKARTQIETAYRITEDIFSRNSDNNDAILDHAQSEYWIGAVPFRLKDYSAALRPWQAYEALTRRLYKTDSGDFDWAMEVAWAKNNIALVNSRLGNHENAKSIFLSAEEQFETALKLSPNDFEAEMALANVWEGLARVAINSGNRAEAIKYREQRLEFFKPLVSQQPKNFKARFGYAQTLSRLIRDNLLDVNSEQFQVTVKSCIEQYKILLEHDPSNQFWIKDYRYFVTELIKENDPKYLKQVDLNALEIHLDELGGN